MKLKQAITTNTRKWTPALLRRTPRRSAASVMAMIREHEERKADLANGLMKPQGETKSD